MIKNNLENINQQIKSSCKKAKRLENEIQLVAVCKKQPVDKIAESLNCGVKILAVNYVQEWKAQKLQLKNTLNQWHFIGKLQTNKVKDVVGEVELIHSVDRLKLAKAIHSECVKKNTQQKILLQINIANESTKAGFKISELGDAIDEIITMPALKLLGFMIMPPIDISEEESKKYFKLAKHLLIKYQQKYPKLNLKKLSMGTSGDYKIAIEMGATLIRLGTIIYGQREY